MVRFASCVLLIRVATGFGPAAEQCRAQQPTGQAAGQAAAERRRPLAPTASFR